MTALATPILVVRQSGGGQVHCQIRVCLDSIFQVFHLEYTPVHLERMLDISNNNIAEVTVL